jgi:aminopeptidase N
MLASTLIGALLTSWASLRADEPLRTAGDRPFEIKHIRLDLRVDLAKKTVDARATLDVRALRPIASLSFDAVEFEVRGVSVARGEQDASPTRFSHDGQKLAIDLDRPWPGDEAGTIRVDYRVREPRSGLHFFGPTDAEPDVPLTVWSQGEAITNRFWFPCVDRPNQRQSTELVVTVADGYEVLSNGKLLNRKANDDQTVTWHWRQEQPHVAYLVTLVVGKFDVTREDWNGLPVSYYVPRGRQPDVARTFGRTREMLDFFSKRFGIAYPWEKYAQVVVEQFTAGGMENTSATTLTDRALLNERAFLDTNPDGLIAHELAHQWWGDLVTCRDWSHLWLNEGFATFAEVIWAEHHLGANEGAYLLVEKGRSAMAGGKERPVVDRHYSTPASMFDARSYPKGGWLLHMLRRQVGEEAFWRGLSRYGTEHRLRSVETADLRRTFERETGRDLERFFYDWTERPGHPVLEIASEYLPETKQVRLVVKQTQAGEAFHVPLKVLLRGGSESKMVLVEQGLSEKEHTFFALVSDRPTRIDIDPEQSLLAEIKESKGRDLWLAQLASADVAARVRAAEYFGKSKTPADRDTLIQALATEKFWGTQVEIVAALGESGGDSSRAALIKTLSHTHPKVRRAAADQLAKFRNDAAAADALKSLLAKGDDSYLVEAAALKAYAKVKSESAVPVLLPWLAKSSQNELLRSATLEGLGETQDIAALDTLTTWTKRGKPRLARAAALTALSKLGQAAALSDAQRSQVVTTISACLDNESMPIRRAAITALRDLGRTASPSLSALDALARHDPDERLRFLAQKAASQVRSQSPVPAELGRLREELESLRKAQEALKIKQEQIEKLERKGK